MRARTLLVNAGVLLPLHVDQSQLPLLRLTYVGDFPDDELVRFLTVVSAVVLKSPGRKVGIIDLSKATAGTAKQRKMQADWIRDHEKVLARDFAAAAIVTSSAVVRGAVTAVFWIRPLPLPTQILATVTAAEAWLVPYRARL